MEHGYGILQSKYHFIAQPVELHHLDEIDDLIVACIIMHNMMVYHCIQIMEGIE